MPTKLYWNRENAGAALAQALRTLGEQYPLPEGPGTPAITLVGGRSPGALRVARRNGNFEIAYGTTADALRGVGAALADLPADGQIEQSTPLQTLGIMLDCSRNAVMTVAHVKRWLRQLALLGYNMVMLYTEDTYRLAGEPFFGFLRGAYTPEELKELDTYAGALGIEMIGCIQTLGHLEQILKWNVYGGVKDTNGVMLADEPATYALIDKMIATYAACFRSRRIHVGMDEAWDLGRGQYINRFGFRREFDIFNDHLAKVLAICKRHSMQAMIWSDMYFRLGSKTGAYYDPDSVVPDDVRAAIPPEAQLVYWDYYHPNVEDYLGMIARHRALGREPIMASGVWTWKHLWYGQGITQRAAGACIEACRRAKLPELFFTMWGDDGGYCEYDSALAGLAWAAQMAYGGQDDEVLRRQYEAACGIGYADALRGCAIQDQTLGGRVKEAPVDLPVSILWDDPLLGMYYLSMKAKMPEVWASAAAHFRAAAKDLERFAARTEPVDLDHALALARCLAAKIEFRMELEDAYMRRNKAAAGALIEKAAGTAESVEQLHRTFRRTWHARNKPFGFEVVQVRLAGLAERYREAARLLSEWQQGLRERIEELDEGLAAPADAMAQLRVPSSYGRLATASAIL